MMKLNVNSCTILVVTSGKKKLDFHNLRVLRGILGGVFKNQKLFRIKQYLRNHQTIFYLSILCANITIFLIFANFSIFWRMFNCNFWNANLGYLDTFLRGMLESKLTLNNFDFKCYIKFFFVRARFGPKTGVGWGRISPPPLMEIVGKNA